MTSLAPALRSASWARSLDASELAGVQALPRVAVQSDPLPGLGQRVQVSQEETGNTYGISRQRMNRALEKDGLLRVEYGGVNILDLEGLKKR